MSDPLLNKIRDLDDSSLPILTAFVAGEHCMLASNDWNGTDLADEVYTTCVNTFNTRPRVVQCASISTVDDFNDAILTTDDEEDEIKQPNNDEIDIHRIAFAPTKRISLASVTKVRDPGEKRIANVIIAADLDIALPRVQVQLIELLRTRRIFTRSAMQTAPADLLLIVTLSSPAARLSYHLNDMIALSNLEWRANYNRTTASVNKEDIAKLRVRAKQTRLTAEMDAYLHDIVLSMRMSRYVQAGVTATATRHFRAICKALAPLHGISFVTPTLVVLAARQIYPHRIVLATADTEKSLQWGSHPQAVKELLDTMTVGSTIDDVIASVETPL